MAESEQLPCGRCGQSVDLREPDCPHCGAGLLVDVLLHGHPPDPRLRYKVARAAQSLPGAPALTAIQAGLAGSPPVLARGVTRAFAHDALPLLSENGLRGSIEKHQAATASQHSPWRLVLGGLAAVVLLAVTWVGWQRFVQKMEPKGPRLTVADLPTGLPTRPGQATPIAAAASAPRSPRELAKSGLLATASLRCPNSVGSGFFVRADLLVTNGHVVCAGSDEIQVVMSDNRQLAGRVLRKAEHVDLALVSVAGAGAQPLPLGDVGDLEVGDKVVIVGSPLGLDFTVHEGSVSSLRRSASGVAYMQLDAKLNPGNSGGPVIDGQGRVVGVVTLKVTGGPGVEGIGLALPINYAYGPDLGFFNAPSAGAASSPAFAKMVSLAKNGTDALEGPGTQRPEPAAPVLDDRDLLVAASVDQYGILVLRVVRVTDVEPRFEEISVKVWSGMEAFCTIKSDIRTWKRGDASLATAGMDARAAVALRQLSQGQTLFIGEAPLRWDLCTRTKMRPGIEVELEGANPIANRLTLR